MNPTVLVLADDLFWKTKIEHTLKSAQATGVFIDKSPRGVSDSRPISM